MNYFRVVTVHRSWLEMEIAKGNIFYDTHNGFNGVAGRKMISTGKYRQSWRSYDDMPTGEVMRLIKLYGCVYWRN